VAVAVPRAPLIWVEVGLQLSVNVVPVAVIVGDVISNVHVAVRDEVALFPQPSVAIHVLVWLRVQPLLVTAPVEAVGVTGPQLSVAVAVPRAESIEADDGLQDAIVPLVGLPVAVITGAVISNVQVAVRNAVEVFPQPSVALHVLV
jgi:hypothetical protein